MDEMSSCFFTDFISFCLSVYYIRYTWFSFYFLYLFKKTNFKLRVTHPTYNGNLIFLLLSYPLFLKKSIIFNLGFILRVLAKIINVTLLIFEITFYKNSLNVSPRVYNPQSFQSISVYLHLSVIGLFALCFFVFFVTKLFLYLFIFMFIEPKIKINFNMKIKNIIQHCLNKELFPKITLYYLTH